ncbi:M14 family metallopeptidase [Thalassotalea marina]|uniref:Peptidase n=1 Tax=Thalassotalea marina TaxID=1673741 RepID=A0A919BN40_9GAMM|nr:M14 family metallocarboxypeptidase [Thalassotalea marina]GHG01672.1 peptidase [Thalassotalea marina]
MQSNTPYPIGTPGQKWQQSEKQLWLANQQVKRSYQQEVVSKIHALANRFNTVNYGALPISPDTYPLIALVSKHYDAQKPTVLVTGGVHGYETSGVHGALLFASDYSEQYEQHFNFIIAPCISPWGYETINRWNANAIDPNRSFYADSPAEESAALIDFIAKYQSDIIVHIDLHETTDTDNSEFRPALAARDGSVHDNWNIPDGFYLVADSENPQAEFQTAIINAVAQVTHIAPADEENRLIGVPIEQEGVINYAAKQLGLCMGLTNAQYVTTTEVYPDSPKVDDANCNLAQATVVTSGLDYVLSQKQP